MKNLQAFAHIKGSSKYPYLQGYAYFFAYLGGSALKVKVTGFPVTWDPIRFHGFHIHQYGDCSGADLPEPFPHTGEHYNPFEQPHGLHAGDLPPLPVSRGISLISFYTGAFKPEDVIGRSIVVHENADDFHTNPAGNSGLKMGCGKIVTAEDGYFPPCE